MNDSRNHIISSTCHGRAPRYESCGRYGTVPFGEKHEHNKAAKDILDAAMSAP